MSNSSENGQPAPPENADAYVDQGVGSADQIQRLWAPYRMNYIVKDAAAPGAGQPKAAPVGSDPFVEVPKLSDEEGLIVARGTHVYCLLNLYPYNSGHMMVVPYRQVANLEDLTPAESAELMLFAQTAITVVKQVSSPHALNVGFNLGKASGGSVADHLHMHIVPRWTGDANFMTVIDGTKVLPQLLKDTRALLARAWSELEQAPGVARA